MKAAGRHKKPSSKYVEYYLDRSLAEEVIAEGKKLLDAGINPKFTAQMTACNCEYSDYVLAEMIIDEAKKLTRYGINPRFCCSEVRDPTPKHRRGAIRPLKNGGHWNHVKEAIYE